MDNNFDNIPTNSLFESFRASRNKRKRTGKGFGEKSSDILLNLVQSTLPRGGKEWELIADRYNQTTGEGRNGGALKQKFYRMVNAKKPTGDSQMPPHILRAKTIQLHIESKGFVGNFGGSGRTSSAHDNSANADDDDNGSKSSDSDSEEEQTQGECRFSGMFNEAPNSSSTGSLSMNERTKIPQENPFDVTSSVTDASNSIEQKSKNSRPSGGPSVNQQRRQLGSTSGLHTYLYSTCIPV